MVSNRPGPIPPAFQGASPPSFIGLTDDHVLKVAEHYFHLASAFPLASRQRAVAWEMFDDAMAELSARGLRHILRKLRERGELGAEPRVHAELSRVLKRGASLTGARLAEVMREALRAGAWQPGEELPGRKELNAVYGCALNQATVDKAMLALAGDGLAQQRPDGRYCAKEH